MQVHTFPSVIIYIYIRSHFFFCSILCATAPYITMSCLDIDTSRRVVFSWVLLKSAGYSVSQIKNRHWEAILIASVFSYRLPTNWQANAKRLMEIQLPIKDPFSTPNDSTSNNRNEILYATTCEQFFGRRIDSRINCNIQRQSL